MFTPNQADVRRFFCQAYTKGQNAQPLEAIEALAYEWMKQHPEYSESFANEAVAIQQMGTVSPDHDNPFLHISMHLSISEQCSIDQPPGIRQAVELLAAKRQDVHEAHHLVMECFGRMLWESQRSGRPPDGQAYIDHVRRLATQDPRG
ncbi:MAG: hypothetical protein RL357_1527 [Pseudomonadota bacterium]